MSIQAALVAHLNVAKDRFGGALNATETASEAEVAKVEKVIGRIEGPLDAQKLEDTFERYVREHGETPDVVDLVETARRVFAGGDLFVLINDPTKFTATIDAAKAELATLRTAALSEEMLGDLRGILPDDVTKGRSEAEVHAIVVAIRDYGVQLIDLLGGALNDIAGRAASFRGRAVEGARLGRVAEKGKEIADGRVLEVLVSFDWKAGKSK